MAQCTFGGRALGQRRREISESIPGQKRYGNPTTELCHVGGGDFFAASLLTSTRSADNRDVSPAIDTPTRSRRTAISGFHVRFRRIRTVEVISGFSVFVYRRFRRINVFRRYGQTVSREGKWRTGY